MKASSGLSLAVKGLKVSEAYPPNRGPTAPNYETRAQNFPAELLWGASIAGSCCGCWILLFQAVIGLEEIKVQGESELTLVSFLIWSALWVKPDMTEITDLHLSFKGQLQPSTALTQGREFNPYVPAQLH